MESRAFIVGLTVGILATVTMDVVAMIALRLGIAGRGPRRTGPDLIGRWIGYLLQGKFRHTDILQTPPLRGDADRPQCHPLRNGHHGLALVSHVPVTGNGLAGTRCAG
jgi:hypothetical protein